MLAMRQKLLDHAKQSVTDALKTTSVQVKCIIQKTAEPTGDLICNKISNKINGGFKKFTT